MIKKIFYFYLLIISLIAFTPNNAGVNTGGDKTNHILAFIVFTILYYLTFKSYKKIFLYGIMFGIYIEIVQYFLPYRSCDFLDIIVDILGLFLGTILILIEKKLLNILK